jgi:hypothetical protein
MSNPLGKKLRWTFPTDKIDGLIRSYLRGVGGKTLTSGVKQFNKLGGFEVLHGYRNTTCSMVRMKRASKMSLLRRGFQTAKRKIIPIHYLAERKLTKRVKVHLSLRSNQSLWVKVDVFVDEDKTGVKGRSRILGDWQRMGHLHFPEDALTIAEVADEWHNQGFIVRNKVQRSKQFQVYRALLRMGDG